MVAEAEPPPTLAPTLARVSPAIVNISVQGLVPVAQNPPLQDSLFRRFFGFPGTASPEASSAQRFQAGQIVSREAATRWASY